MERSVFEGLDGKQAGQRSQKPQPAGLTMVVDWGMGLNRQRDLLDAGGSCIDFAKVAVGVSRLLSGPLLQGKIDSYLAGDIKPFPGGQYLEYAETEGKLERYFEAVAEAGYRWVEVSDNLLPATAAWKEATIRRAREGFGLKVLGEVGRKEGSKTPYLRWTTPGYASKAGPGSSCWRRPSCWRTTARHRQRSRTSLPPPVWRR